MAAGDIHIGDIVQFKIQVLDQNSVAPNLSSATTKNILLQKPDGSLLTKAMSFYTDGTDGIVMYITSNTDLDQSGSWRYQVYLIYDSNEQHTDVTKFKVLANLPIT